MVNENFKYQILKSIMDLAGQGMSNYLNSPNYDEQEKLQKKYYQDIRNIARKTETEHLEPVLKTIPVKNPKQENTVINDFDTEKIKSGTACIPCSRDHLGVSAGFLKEAVRFANREKGMADPEVMWRVHDALMELNAMERGDLAPRNIEDLPSEEKELAKWALNKSAKLRHQITNARTPDELNKVSVEVENVSKQFMSRMWELATSDDTVQKLCKDLKGEEYEHCVDKINMMFNEQKQKSR